MRLAFSDRGEGRRVPRPRPPRSLSQHPGCSDQIRAGAQRLGSWPTATWPSGCGRELRTPPQQAWNEVRKGIKEDNPLTDISYEKTKILKNFLFYVVRKLLKKKKQGTDVFYHQGSGTAYYSLVRKSLIYLLSVSSRTAKSILHWLQEVLGLKPRSGKKKWFF